MLLILIRFWTKSSQSGAKPVRRLLAKILSCTKWRDRGTIMPLQRARTPIMTDHPKVVQIYIGDICNLRCSFCIPRQQAWSEGKKWVNGDVVDRDMDPKILDAISPVFQTADWLYLTGGGEPFACKAFWEFIEAKRYSNGIALNSNGTLITDKNIDRVLTYPNKLNIGVSLNAATRETYLKIVGDDVFDLITANCRNLVRRRTERATPLSVFASMTVMKDNLHEIVPFVRLCKEIGVDTASVNTSIFPFDYEWPLDRQFKAKSQYVLGDPELAAEFNRQMDMAAIVADEIGIPLLGRGGQDSNWEGPCRELFDFLVIKQDGESNACCMKWNLKTGNIKDFDNFDDMWNSPVRQEMRATVLRGEFPKPCQTMDCPYFRVAEDRKEQGLPTITQFADATHAATIVVSEVALVSRDDTPTSIEVSLRNSGAASWLKGHSRHYNLGARLIKDGLVLREYRAGLPIEMHPGDSLTVPLSVEFSNIPEGDYDLEIDMVLEQQFWFSAQGSDKQNISLKRTT
jgi:MoaA/NifB/PqqE/SkfB family radical SAM enzyme